MADDKEAKQRELDKERTKRERQQAVEEAAKKGFGTVYTDKDQYGKASKTESLPEDTGSQDPKSTKPPSKDVKDKK